MRIDKLRLTCKAGHVFDAEVVVDAPIAVAVASMKAVRCCHCGSGTVFMGGAYGDAPGISSTIAERAAWWIDRGDVGLSSQTIYSVFTRSVAIGPRYPRDPDDYQRCRKLLELIPEWRPDLKKVTAQYPWYRPFVDRWDEFDRLWILEHRDGSAPKLYELMQIAGREADRLMEPEYSE